MSDAMGGAPDMGGDFSHAAPESSREAIDRPFAPDDYPELDDHVDLADRYPSPGWDDGVAREISAQKRTEYSKEVHGGWDDIPVEKELDFDQEFTDAASREDQLHSAAGGFDESAGGITRSELNEILEGEQAPSRDELQKLINDRVAKMNARDTAIDRDHSEPPGPSRGER